MKIHLKKLMILCLCGTLLTITLPYHFTNNPEKTYAANDTFTVTPKENTEFFVNQSIHADQFDFSLNGSPLSSDKLVISPSIFTTSGTKEITVTYDTGTTFYQQKINIEVKEVLVDHLELSSSDITLVRNQTITAASLPDVYLYYNDGTKKVLADYTIEIDWDKELLTISSNGLTITLNVTVTENEISHIEVIAKKSVVPTDYEFVKDDFVVTAYFTNGTNIIVTDYQIQPYTLVDGSETVITIKYTTVTGYCTVKGTTPSKTPVTSTNPNLTENPIGKTPSPTTTIAPSLPNNQTDTTTPTPSTTNADTNVTSTQRPTKITLGKATVTQGIGEKVKISVKTNPKVTVSMHSNNKKVASVTNNGYIKGIGKGSTKVVVTAGSSRAVIRVKVYPAPSKIGVTSSLAPSTSYTIKKGSTRQIPIYFNKGSYSNKITFSSSKKAVASVTSKGKIKAKKAGKTIIHISSFNHKKAIVKVKVTK